MPKSYCTNPKRSTLLAKRICVLGSGTVKEGTPVYRKAILLGTALAREGFTVCHGGYGGVMEAVARGCRNAGGRNIGVTIRKHTPSTPGVKKRFKHPVLTGVNPWADTEVRMPSWDKRLFKLIEMGEAYVFLDGATGTLNELFFVWEMANRKRLAKPIIILGKKLHALVKFLRKDPSLKIPANFQMVSSIRQSIKLLIGYRG